MMSRFWNAWGPLLVAALAAVALVGCASPPPPAPPKPGLKIVLLPQPDGTPSGVVVSTAAGGVTSLSGPYQTASVREKDAAPARVGLTSEAQTRDAYKAIIDVTPPRAERFVVFFRTGGTQLTAESQPVMDRVLAEAERRSGAEIVIIGHTDTKGSTTANDALSLRRAGEVRDMFAKRNFPSNRIETAGRGERELAVPTADEVDEPRNRRVEVLVR